MKPTSHARRTGYKETEIGTIPVDWDLKSLGEMFALQRGYDLTDRQRRKGRVPVFGSAGLNGYHDVARVRGPGVILGRSGASYGQAHYCSVDFWPHNTALYVTDFKGNDHRFVYYFLKGFDFSRHNSGGAQQSLNRNFIAPLMAAIPPTLVEQEAIAKALDDADAWIESLEHLVAKKRYLKQAALHHLTTSRTRLPGFKGGWRYVELGRFGKCHRGVSYNPDLDLSPYDTHSTVRLLRSNNVQQETIVYADMQYVDSQRVAVDQQLKQKDILLCMANGSRALVGKAGQFRANDGFPYTFGAFMGAFRPEPGAADPDFVFALFQTESYRSQLAVLLAGSSINNLTPTDVEALRMYVPSDVREQTAIAQVFCDMDAELAAIETKLNKARQIKQGMMQELLTGRTRLV